MYTTEVKIFADNKDTLNWFEQLWCGAENSAIGIDGVFGGDIGDSISDRIGDSFMERYDDWISDDHYYFSIHTRKYVPYELLHKIVAMVEAKDEDSFVSGRYWEESFGEIGTFDICADSKEVCESSVDVDWSDEFYWDNQVEPAFKAIEL